MKTKSVHCFESECGRAKIYVDNDIPIGSFHDILMELKGMMVDRMLAAHKDQVKEAEEHLKQEERTPCMD